MVRRYPLVTQHDAGTAICQAIGNTVSGVGGSGMCTRYRTTQNLWRKRGIVTRAVSGRSLETGKHNPRVCGELCGITVVEMVFWCLTVVIPRTPYSHKDSTCECQYSTQVQLTVSEKNRPHHGQNPIRSRLQTK